MSGLDVAEKFIELARRATTQSDLSSLLDAVSREMGFTYFALVHHADLRDRSSEIVSLYNYPPAWVEYFIENALFAHDPIHAASLFSHVGFAWSEVPARIRITARQGKILEMAARHGLRNGYTVPANIPGESSGSCSFAVHDEAELPTQSLLLAELIGGFAFEAARRLGRDNSGGAPTSPRPLSPRQHDCLLLVIHGKTDKEIARKLRISEDTVTEYLDLLRRRYGVKNRLTLAIRAIYDGQISFIEAFAEKPPLRGG